MSNADLVEAVKIFKGRTTTVDVAIQQNDAAKLLGRYNDDLRMFTDEMGISDEIIASLCENSADIEVLIDSFAGHEQTSCEAKLIGYGIKAASATKLYLKLKQALQKCT